MTLRKREARYPPDQTALRPTHEWRKVGSLGACQSPLSTKKVSGGEGERRGTKSQKEQKYVFYPEGDCGKAVQPVKKLNGKERGIEHRLEARSFSARGGDGRVKKRGKTKRKT